MVMNFSVLMSVYYKERPEYLKAALESVFQQTLPPTEVVLVEDGALNAELYSVVHEMESRYAAQLKVVKILENSGLGNALNIGLEHCSYDLVVRADSDDICKPNRMERQVNFMSQNLQIDCCSAWIEEFIDSPTNVKTIKNLPETSEEIFEYGKTRCPINHPAVIFRKQSVLNAGGYKHFPLFEDYYLWVRMLMNGCKMYNLQESLLYFRSSSDMFRRRGGWGYARTEIRLNRLFYKMGYISLSRLLRNVAVRSTVRIMPNALRARVYMHLLR